MGYHIQAGTELLEITQEGITLPKSELLIQRFSLGFVLLLNFASFFVVFVLLPARDRVTYLILVGLAPIVGISVTFVLRWLYSELSLDDEIFVNSLWIFLLLPAILTIDFLFYSVPGIVILVVSLTSTYAFLIGNFLYYLAKMSKSISTTINTSTSKLSSRQQTDLSFWPDPVIDSPWKFSEISFAISTGRLSGGMFGAAWGLVSLENIEKANKAFDYLTLLVVLHTPDNETIHIPVLENIETSKLFSELSKLYNYGMTYAQVKS